jgi:hypothetical protein
VPGSTTPVDNITYFDARDRGTPTAQLAVELNGVSLAISTPEGWHSAAQDGVVLAETITAIEAGAPVGGMAVYIFAPELDDMRVTPIPGETYALAVLRKVITMPEHIGPDDRISEPQALHWDGLDGAYYLSTAADGTRSMVIGVVPPQASGLIVWNLSIPAEQESRFRPLMLAVLDGVVIEGQVLSNDALENLPNPLVFPALPGRSAHELEFMVQ